jgi:hypothetical protein
VGYRTDDGWQVQLDVLNLLNTQTNQISYAYGSLIKTDSLYNSLQRRAGRTGGSVSERRHGLCRAPDRTPGGQTYDNWRVLIVLPLIEWVLGK